MAAEPAAAQPTYQQMTEMEGNYLLADGHKVRLFVSDGTLYMERGRNQQPLEPAGQNRWVTQDHRVALRFKAGLASDDIVLDYGNPAEAPPIRLAARETHGRGGAD